MAQKLNEASQLYGQCVAYILYMCVFVPVLVAGDPVRDVGDGLTVALFVPEATS